MQVCASTDNPGYVGWLVFMCFGKPHVTNFHLQTFEASSKVQMGASTSL